MTKENTEISKVVQNYKGFEITVEREMSLGGDELIYFSIFSEDGREMESNFTSGSESLLTMSNILRGHVDDMIQNPQDYE